MAKTVPLGSASKIPVAVQKNKSNKNKKDNNKSSGSSGEQNDKTAKKKQQSNKEPNMEKVIEQPVPVSSMLDTVDSSYEKRFDFEEKKTVQEDDDGQPDEWISPIQNLFLWCISAIYLFAFFSFYVQVRGLYGNKGVLPLRYFVAQKFQNSSSFSFDQIQRQSPSMVWMFAANAGMSLTTALEFVSLLGTLTAFLQLCFESVRGPINYLLLFILYQSCVNVGQTFLYFQWDAFLLETGALAALISIRSSRQSVLNRLRPHPILSLWTVRWLLFKFMFSSGIVKFTARCPVWWSLRALDIHFESQPLPTPLAWYAHHLPQNWLHLAVALHFVIEIAGPFLFFTPFVSLKWLAFGSQIFLQIAILLTGNYNFFNLLTMALCLTLLDDEMIQTRSKRNNSKWFGSLEIFIFGVVLGIITYFTIHYFDVSPPGTLGELVLKGPLTKVNFTYDQFNLFVTNAVAAAMILGLVSFILAAIYALYKSLSYGSLFGRLIHFATTMFYIFLCAIILMLNMVPLAELDVSGSHLKSIPAPIKRWYIDAQRYHLISSYGLFRTMTGDGGRPELIIEGANDSDGEGWKPYYFRFKPVDLYERPKFIIPHQPRLDWQMWFAALGTYQQNPWLINLCYRILDGEPDVLELLHSDRLPFGAKNPPKFLRISRYLYKFTDSTEDRAWWRKATNRHAYLPVVTKETLKSALRLEDIKIPHALKVVTKDRAEYVAKVMDFLYEKLVLGLCRRIPVFVVMWSLVGVALLFSNPISVREENRSKC